MSIYHHVFSILFLCIFFSKFTYGTMAQKLDHHKYSKDTFIVRINNHQKPSDFSHVESWYKSILNNVGFISNDDPFLHVYKTVFDGFSTRLTREQVRALKDHPSVVGMFPDITYQLHTTRSPHFLGLKTYHSPTGLLKDSTLGSEVVVGIIDTGIWPESPSFRDDGLGPVPSHFKGTCQGGKDFPASLCNKKLVGVRYFSAGMSATSENLTQLDTARDQRGHGTHTASTVAGQPHNASFFGYAAGEATGIASKARLAIYKACWTIGCRGSDVLAAIDKAVEDNVDVISISLGGATSRYAIDPIAIGAYGAVRKNIFFSASAGNRGPTEQTASNIAPWIATIGAGTIDRTFPVDLVLGNNDVLTGTSLYTSGNTLTDNQYFPLVHSNDSIFSSACFSGTLSSKEVKGKIDICGSGLESAVMKGINVKDVGGVGIVVTNDWQYGETLYSDPYFGIPGLTITNSAREKLFDYYQNSTRNAKAKIVFHGTKVGGRLAPAIAGFSSRGPNRESIYVLKPDVIAPGVDILASWPNNISPSRLPNDPRRSEFNILSGTSMSCPHVSGIAALLKGAHPDWNPSMIRSALMTTAYKNYEDGKPLVAQETNSVASVWVRGAGHVDPEKANDPGLVYDLNMDDYIDFLCASNYSTKEVTMITKEEVRCDNRTNKNEWDLNYPAIIVGETEKVGRLNKVNVTVTRTLTNVWSGSSNYRAELVSPKGANVRVNPSELSFKSRGEKKSYQVDILAEKDKDLVMNAEEGSLTWTDGKHRVTIPLVLAI